MASIGRDTAVEAALAALPGVVAVEAAIAVDGFPGRRSARVDVLVDEGAGEGAAGAIARAALDALRVAHGTAIRGSLAIAVGGADGVRRPIAPGRVIAAAGLRGATAAGDELLLGAQTEHDA